MNPPAGTQVDAVVVGAGVAGLYMLRSLLEAGLTVKVFESAKSVGGTWHWNAYPGARCDVDSLEYSYGFSEALQQEWHWSERNASQSEILRYLEHVMDRFDLRRHIQFDTRVVSAAFDETAGHWVVETSGGDRTTARFCIMATGCLSSVNVPQIEGIDSFEGRVLHTGSWPHESIDFRDMRVGIVGTGSSAVQAIPELARQAAHLHVFQRTASWVIPAGNVPLDPNVEKNIKSEYAAFRERNRAMTFAFGSSYAWYPDLVNDVPAEERTRRLEEAWQLGGLAAFGGCFGNVMLDEAANHEVAEFVRGKIRATVRDPATAELLCPTTLIGCKRLCVGTRYYETFNRSNVGLVDLRETPIVRMTPTGLETDRASYGLDFIVFATGFDAMTGALSKIDIRGRGGELLRQKWSAGPKAYLGLGISGFPNLFLISGPGSPSVLSNMVVSIEQHVEWIRDCISHLRERGLSRIEANAAAEDEWVAFVSAIAGFTLYQRCDSWYLGANVPGKPRTFMPFIGFPQYVERCRAVVQNGYEGFELR